MGMGISGEDGARSVKHMPSGDRAHMKDAVILNDVAAKYNTCLARYMGKLKQSMIKDGHNGIEYGISHS